MFFLFDLRQIDHIFRQNLTDILGTFLRCIRNQLCINGNALNLSVHSALLFPLLTLFSSHFNTFSVTFIADFGRLIHPAPTFCMPRNADRSVMSTSEIMSTITSITYAPITPNPEHNIWESPPPISPPPLFASKLYR